MKTNHATIRTSALIVWLLCMMIFTTQRSAAQALTVLHSTYHVSSSLHYACMDMGDCVEIRADAAASAAGSISSHTYRWYGNNHTLLATDVGDPVHSWCTAFHDMVDCYITDSVGTVTHTNSIEIYVDHTADISVSDFTGSAALGDSIHLALPTSGTFSDTWTTLTNSDASYYEGFTARLGDSIIYNIAAADLTSTGFLLNITNVACIESGGYNIPVYLSTINTHPAGPSQTICNWDFAVMAAAGSGVWRQGFNNPEPYITDTNSANTTITGFTWPGRYTFYWISSAGVDTAYVYVTESIAGPDIPTWIGGSAKMLATNLGYWTAMSGNPGTATITGPSLANTTITGFSAPGIYHFIWTNGNLCKDTAAVIVSPTLAGPDRVISCATLPGGSVTMGASSPGIWSAMTGNPGTATITTPSNPATTITAFTAPGVYSFIWTYGSLTDTVSVTVTSKPDAGPDRATLINSATGLGATGTGTWTVQAGNPGSATIITPASAASWVQGFPVAGIYHFIWTNSDGCSDTMAITVTILYGDAGPDQVNYCTPLAGSSFLMAADPASTGIWSAATGNPGTATITNPTLTNTTVTGFSAGGVYNFVWTDASGPDTMQITIYARADAGPDVAISSPTFPGGIATLTGVGSGTWQGFNNAPAVASPNSAVTTASNFPQAGRYVYTWYNASQAYTCGDTVEVVVTALQGPAGADQAICWGSVATMAATGSGVWSAAGSNPGSATITSPSLATTTIGGFTRSGTYSFIWTTGSSADTLCIMIDSLSGHSAVHDIPCDSTFGSMDLFITGGVAPYRDSLSYFFGTGGPRGPVSTSVSYSLTEHYTGLNGFTRYIVDITDSLGCTFTVWPTDSVRHSPCPSDSVWPGDADHNGLADNNDLLPIGTAYGLNGFTRQDQSIVWSAHYTQDWGLHFTNGTNAKHADCNGDGVIDAGDTTAVLANFGLTHSKTDGPNAPWRSATPGLTLKFSKDSLIAGDTLVTSIILGDSANTVSNIYGLAFTYHYDPLVLDSTTTSFRFTNSFIGNSTDKISIYKDFRTAGQVKAAVTGINHVNRSGYGLIARFSCIITTDNLNGKDLAYYSNINFITDITAIDKDENAIQLNAGTDSTTVAYESATGIHDITTERLSLHPNPASGQVTVTAQSAIEQTIITDVLGQRVHVQTGLHIREQTIDISAIPAGVYIMHIYTQTGSGTDMLLITR